ncbi:MAG: sensor domain-containing diguanylate cyclase [Halanaerobiales bacterium]|nr:sensor domain-containing diguanylate cyclase [Halanaerobiales bacterium]
MVDIIINIILVVALIYLFYWLKGKYKKEKRIEKSKGIKINYEALFDKFTYPMVIVNQKDSIKKVNRAFLDEFDLNLENVLNKNIKNIIDINESESKTNYLKQKSESGQVYKGEIEISTSNFGEKKYKLINLPIDKKGGLVGKHIIFIEADLDELNISTMLRKSRRKIKDLHKTALKMKEVKTQKEVYNLTIKAAENILDFDLCTLDIVEGDKLVVKATSRSLQKGDSISTDLKVQSLATHVYNNKSSHLTGDIQKLEFAKPTSDKYHSAITIPIGELGIFQAVSTKINEFTREDLELVELLIAHTNSALKRIDYEKRITYLGFHDNLTGLYNRNYLHEEIKRLDTKRQQPISVIICDLNGLKLVNDVFGHDEGDQYIIKTADLLKRCMRKEDILGRWGGDEFLILLPNTAIIDAEKIIERIINEVKKTYNSNRPISMSLGSATKNENIKTPIDTLIEKADYKMYKNKNQIHSEKSNPLIDMIKEKMENNELNKSEVYRLDKLLEMF